MRLPRDVSGAQLAAALRALGCVVDRQTGSHIRLTTSRGGEHHVTIPRHDPMRVGTQSAVLADIADHLGIERSELVRRLGL